MKKTLLSVTILSTGLGLAGCNDADQNGELCAYYVQKDMNARDFDSAISRLETQSCQDSYPNNTHLIDLGTAYMGRAGTSMPDIMAALMDSGESENDDSFQSFTSSLTDSQSGSALTDLKMANDTLVSFTDNATSSENTVTGVKLISSLVSLAQTTSALNNLLGGNLDSWINSDGNDLSLERSTCAIELINPSVAPDTCIDPLVIDSGNTAASGTISFTDATYGKVVVTDTNGVAQTFLANTTLNLMVMTDGYCDANYQNFYAANEVAPSGLYPCPVNKGGEELYMEEYLLETLKAGVNNITDVINSIDSLDAEEKADVIESVEEFEAEIAVNGGSIDTLTIDELLDYLNKED